MRTPLLLLAFIAAAAGCDGLLGINAHPLTEAGVHDGGAESDGESGVTVNPLPDGGHEDASAAGEQ